MIYPSSGSSSQQVSAQPGCPLMGLPYSGCPLSKSSTSQRLCKQLPSRGAGFPSAGLSPHGSPLSRPHVLAGSSPQEDSPLPAFSPSAGLSPHGSPLTKSLPLAGFPSVGSVPSWASSYRGSPAKGFQP